MLEARGALASLVSLFVEVGMHALAPLAAWAALFSRVDSGRDDARRRRNPRHRGQVRVLGAQQPSRSHRLAIVAQDRVLKRAKLACDRTSRS